MAAAGGRERGERMEVTLLLHRAAISLVMVSILAAVDLGCLMFCFACLRLARASTRWPTLLIGFGLAGLMLWSCLTLLLRPASGVANGAAFGESAFFGGLSFIVAIFAAAEWPLRQWYVGVKGRLRRWFVRQSRAFFLYLRDHHQFFGWLALLAACAHTALLLPDLNRLPPFEVWTGLIALAALAALTFTGQWIAWATRRSRLPTGARWWHLALTLAFVLAFAAHV